MKKETTTVRKSRLFPRTLGEAVNKVTKPLMKKHGLPDGLIEQWHTIAGDELAAYTTPVSCKRSKKSSGATLIVEVPSSHALIAQHASGVIQEKINLHYGYQLIERVQFQPGTFASAKVKPSPTKQQVDMAEQFKNLAETLKKD